MSNIKQRIAYFLFEILCDLFPKIGFMGNLKINCHMVKEELKIDGFVYSSNKEKLSLIEEKDGENGLFFYRNLFNNENESLTE